MSIEDQWLRSKAAQASHDGKYCTPISDLSRDIQMSVWAIDEIERLRKNIAAAGEMERRQWQPIELHDGTSDRVDLWVTYHRRPPEREANSYWIPVLKEWRNSLGYQIGVEKITHFRALPAPPEVQG